MKNGGLLQNLASDREQLARFLRARGVQAEDADDILQDLFVKIETSVIGPVGNPRAYLYQMANNLAHDRRRARDRQRRLDDAWMGSQRLADNGADISPNAEQAALAKDLLRRIESALDDLPDRTANIFRRFRVDGEAQKTIANSLGISLSAVEKHLQRAYKVVLQARAQLESDIGHLRKDPERGRGR